MTLTLSNIFLHILGFLYRIFLSRMIGSEGMGIYQLVLPVYSVLSSFCITGLTMATSRLSAEYYSRKLRDRAYSVVSSSLKIFLFLFCIVAFFVLSFSPFIAGKIVGDMRTRASLLILLPCLLFTGIENIIKNFFFGIGKLRPPITSELTEQLVRFAAVVLLLYFLGPASPATSSALIICGMVISEIVSVFILSRFYGKPRLRAKPIYKEIGEIALPVSLSAVFNNLLAAANAILITNRLMAFGMGNSEAISLFGTLFGMTIPLVNLPFGLIGALVTVVIPKISEGAGNIPYLRRKAGKVIQVTSLIALPAICFLILFGAPLCNFVYGDANAAFYMLPLCIAAFFSFYHMSLTAILNGMGYQRRAAAITIIGGIFQLIGTLLVGLKQIGMWGFLIGDIFSAVFCSLLSLHPIVKVLKLKISTRNWFITPGLSAILAALISRFVFLLAVKDGISAELALIPVCILFLLCYFGALHVQGTNIFTYLKKLQS